LSLLMDALRRAETSATADAPANEEITSLAAEPDHLPEKLDTMTLEPVDASLAEIPLEASNSERVLTGESPGTAIETGTNTAPESATGTPLHAGIAAPAAGGGTQQHQAQVALAASMVRKPVVRKHIVFILTGLFTVVLLLTTYYYWKRSNHRLPALPAVTVPSDPLPVTAATGGTLSAAEPVTVTADKRIRTSAPQRAFTDQPRSASPVISKPYNQASRTRPAASSATARGRSYRIKIHKSTRPGKVPSALKQAYRDYQRQAYQQAEQGYQKVLHRYPRNRDALLGLAAIALHRGDRQDARRYYERLLKMNPADKTAHLALQSLSAQQFSLENGSRIKYWLQTDPDNAQLHSALGNQYAAGSQWKEAQQAYFEAQRLAPDNADYAFNLAVSLDRLQLYPPALKAYIQARELAKKNGSLFDQAQLDRRIAQLQAQLEQTP